MAKVLKRNNFSQKDFKVDSGVLRAKDSTFHFLSDSGGGSMANFNTLDPLLYWTQPTDCKIKSTAKVLFIDGLAYYTFDGTWVLDFFYASSSFIPASYESAAHLGIFETGPSTFQPIGTVVGDSVEFDTIDFFGPYCNVVANNQLKVVINFMIELSWTIYGLVSPTSSNVVTFMLYKNGVLFNSYPQTYTHVTNFTGNFSGSLIAYGLEDDIWEIKMSKTGTAGTYTYSFASFSIKKIGPLYSV